MALKPEFVTIFPLSYIRGIFYGEIRLPLIRGPYVILGWLPLCISIFLAWMNLDEHIKKTVSFSHCLLFLMY